MTITITIQLSTGAILEFTGNTAWGDIVAQYGTPLHVWRSYSCGLTVRSY